MKLIMIDKTPLNVNQILNFTLKL